MCAMPTTTTTYRVEGMTCGHCVAAITEALGALGGVQSVDVSLETGEVRVSSDGPLDPTAVSAAVDDAGYEVIV